MNENFNTMIEDLKGRDININLNFFSDRQIKNFKKTDIDWHLEEILEINRKDNIYIVDYIDKSIGVSIIH